MNRNRLSLLLGIAVLIGIFVGGPMLTRYQETTSRLSVAASDRSFEIDQIDPSTEIDAPIVQLGSATLSAPTGQERQLWLVIAGLLVVAMTANRLLDDRRTVPLPRQAGHRNPGYWIAPGEPAPGLLLRNRDIETIEAIGEVGLLSPRLVTGPRPRPAISPASPAGL